MVNFLQLQLMTPATFLAEKINTLEVNVAAISKEQPAHFMKTN